jgi:beta-mannosidase
MSEFGFQSLPSYETIRYINQNDSIEISSDKFKNHQKHIRGFQLIDEYMKRDFPVPTNPEDYVYMSQLLQAYGITKGIEAQRRAKPYNMGTLYWQFNDCWPSVSWSSIDYFGNWKALHYKVKNSFQDVLVTSKVENDTLKTWVVNDDLSLNTGELSLKIMDFEGNVIWRDYRTIQVEENSSSIKNMLDLKSINYNKNEVVLVSNFNNKTSFFYFVKPKDLQLKEADIQQKTVKTINGFSIELTSTTFQKNVFLFTNHKGHFSDNFIDMIPNETYNIHFNTDSDKLEDLQLKSFNSFVR